jgi:predicted unusual protein kinase regulating ubiquinone biosynthesis (AarF/ABC1/UbiB family)
MRKRLEKTLPRETVRGRRRVIERRLAEYGLARGPHRLLLDANGEDSHCRRLSAALVSLGPVFSSFGIYLASRVDLFPVRDCLELAAIPDRAAPTPIETIWALLSAEIGCSHFEVYSAFEEEPFESRLMYQSHRAWLCNEEAVTVKVVRPEFEEQLALDGDLLPLLTSAFASEVWIDLPIEDAIHDFRRILRAQLNLMREVEANETIAHHMLEFSSLRVPTVHRSFCASKVLTIERLTGSTIDELIPPFDEGDSRESGTPSEINGVNLRDLANQLTLLWLRLALEGRLFPVEPRAENILVLPNGQIAFTGGTFEALPSEAKANLLDYLIAASTQDPDRACSCLVKELRKSSGAVGDDELHHRLRQAVPFRDGGWSNGGGSDSLAELLFVHWRLASGVGYRPRLNVLGFFRGLFWIANSTRRLTGGRDGLLEALGDLRLDTAISQFKQMISLSQLGDGADKYAAMMMELPRKLDEALTLMSEGNALLRLDGIRSAGPGRQKRPSAVVAFLVLLAALVVLSHYTSSAVAGTWVDRISAIAFILLGTLLLRVVSSTW